MKKTKRWILIFAALFLLMAHTGALRASSLILNSKGSTSTKAPAPTTTTTTEAPLNETKAEESEVTEAPANKTSSKRVLTGIPQIDYVWDPNLPRELNGFNLSDYPFFNTVPTEDEIDFKCKGLHDGFYASIQHKCQLYHHCVYGVRYDFLCANFTAFDQRTFICHFTSDVDCKNSAKYWYRNDVLYMATTTTTLKPPTTTTTTTVAPPRRNRPNRRPLRRRRPQVDDYYDEDEYDDDYYEERAFRRRKQRPRNRRPEYDDEEEYEDRRSFSDDRHDRRPYKDRNEDEEDDDYQERRKSDVRPKNRPRPSSASSRFGGEEQRPGNKKKNNTLERRSRPSQPPKKNMPEERRSFNNERPRSSNKERNRSDSSLEEERPRPSSKDRNRFESSPDEERPRSTKNRNRFDSSKEDERRPAGRRRPIERRPQPADDDVDDDKSDETSNERHEKPKNKEILVKPSASGSSSLSSLFEKPRAAPRIARPVPNYEKSKYSYSKNAHSSTTTSTPLADDEYYDEADYENEEVSPRPHSDVTREVSNKSKFALNRNSEKEDDPPYEEPHRKRDKQNYRMKPFSSIMSRDGPRHRSKLQQEEYEDDIEEEEPIKSHKHINNRKHKNEEEIEDVISKERDEASDDERIHLPVALDTQSSREEQNEKDRSNPIEEVEQEEEEEEPIREARPIVRIVKRPFLPSRGGSPYLPRGLQPVGNQQKQSSTESTPIDMGSTISGVRLLEHGAPILRSKEYSSNNYNGPRTTLPPQTDIPKVKIEDLYETEYDVTLNDALNPTLKPLTSNRNYPTSNGYSTSNNRNPLNVPNNYHNRDSYYSSTDLRRRAVFPQTQQSQTIPAPRQQGLSSRAQHQYYDY